MIRFILMLILGVVLWLIIGLILTNLANADEYYLKENCRKGSFIQMIPRYEGGWDIYNYCTGERSRIIPKASGRYFLKNLDYKPPISMGVVYNSDIEIDKY